MKDYEKNKDVCVKKWMNRLVITIFLFMSFTIGSLVGIYIQIFR